MPRVCTDYGVLHNFYTTGASRMDCLEEERRPFPAEGVQLCSLLRQPERRSFTPVFALARSRPCANAPNFLDVLLDVKNLSIFALCTDDAWLVGIFKASTWFLNTQCEVSGSSRSLIRSAYVRGRACSPTSSRPPPPRPSLASSRIKHPASSSSRSQAGDTVLCTDHRSVFRGEIDATRT